MAKKCAHTNGTFICERPEGHPGWHQQSNQLLYSKGYETTNWGDDGLATWASRDEKRRKESKRR